MFIAKQIPQKGANAHPQTADSDNLHFAEPSGHWCADQRPLGGMAATLCYGGQQVNIN